MLLVLPIVTIMGLLLASVLFVWEFRSQEITLPSISQEFLVVNNTVDRRDYMISYKSKDTNKISSDVKAKLTLQYLTVTMSTI